MKRYKADNCESLSLILHFKRQIEFIFKVLFCFCSVFHLIKNLSKDQKIIGNNLVHRCVPNVLHKHIKMESNLSLLC